ncbi:hypothetical protein CH063_14381 [Colletotrichum higginsianum]|uniref:Uncharacterized protein n=1 Tax=Colletotrichum higginsianum (strain IMI 349063) TaxID=759273 RepID=H1VYC0_COLHI|nr:hypothetical protein CH063_14381 [Colletotrichum higginsianum]
MGDTMMRFCSVRPRSFSGEKRDPSGWGSLAVPAAGSWIGVKTTEARSRG